MQEQHNHIEKVSKLEHKSYMGVELPMAEKRDTAPKIESFDDYVEEAFSRDMERIIATSWALNEPILLEGGTSLGKTTAVKKMCAELGYEVHYQNLNNHTDPADLMGKYTPNPNKGNENQNDPNYVFADGSVTKALRIEKGRIRVLILDEYNAANPGAIIRLHEVLDAYKRNGDVTLTEDGNEIISVQSNSLRIIALTNPAGGGFSDREPLDPAQIRRWSYHKLPDKLPNETFKAGVSALFGLGETKTPIDKNKEKFTPSNETSLSREMLSRIPGASDIVTQFFAFHEVAEKMVEDKEIGNNQRQKFTFDRREEPRRFQAYISKFFRGNIGETAREALRYFYAGKVLDPVDKAKLETMISGIDYKPEENPERQGLGSSFVEPSQPQGPSNKKEYTDKLRYVLRKGIKVKGPKEFSKFKNTTTGIDQNLFEAALKKVELPVIHYSEAELDDIKAEGHSVNLESVLSVPDFLSKMKEGTLLSEDFYWSHSKDY